jgi:hypothetical protein
MKISVILIFFFCYTIQGLTAQQDEKERRFTAAVVMGINISQIDGDEDGTYSKVGFNGGARGGVRFGKNMELCTEILFSQKGSYIKSIDKLYHLDYMEVPLIFYYKDWETMNKKQQKYMRVMIGAGFSYSRLLNSTINQYGEDIRVVQPGFQDPFLKNDFMFLFDLNFLFFKNIGLNLRWSRSLLTIVEEPLRQNFSYAINRSIIIRVLVQF